MCDIDLADYKTILQHQGKISGYIRYLDINSFAEEVFLPLKDEIQKAKGVLMEIDIKEGESYFPFNMYMHVMQSSTNDDAEFISCINEIKEIDEGFCLCRIIITGM